MIGDIFPIFPFLLDYYNIKQIDDIYFLLLYIDILSSAMLNKYYLL